MAEFNDKPPGVAELKEWLKDHGFSQAWLARILGISTSKLSHYMTYRSMFPALEAAAVEEVTDGAIKAQRLQLTEEEAAAPLAACRRRKSLAAAG